MEIDKLVQLLESPIFLHLRLQLLEPEKFPFLFKTLYGLLMLLPQTAAFTTLRNRLTTVTTIGVLHMIPRSGDITPLPEGIDFTALLEHFVKVRKRHHEHVVEVRLAAEQQASSALLSPREKKRKVAGTGHKISSKSLVTNTDSAVNTTSTAVNHSSSSPAVVVGSTSTVSVPSTTPTTFTSQPPDD